MDTLLVGEDYFFLPNNNHDKKDFSGAVLLGGYGITAPDFDHDDYDGLDATGKIVIVFTGAPESFPSSERAHYSNLKTKFRAGAARGALPPGAGAPGAAASGAAAGVAAT